MRQLTKNEKISKLITELEEQYGKKGLEQYRKNFRAWEDEDLIKCLLGSGVIDSLSSINESTNQSNRAKAKAGTKSPLKSAIRIFNEDQPLSNIDDLIAVLCDSDYIEDLFYSEHKPIDIHEIEVYKDEKYISYINRNNKQKTAKFKTLKNNLSDINK